MGTFREVGPGEPEIVREKKGVKILNQTVRFCTVIFPCAPRRTGARGRYRHLRCLYSWTRARDPTPPRPNRFGDLRTRPGPRTQGGPKRGSGGLPPVVWA
jgi:hypothetical protein